MRFISFFIAFFLIAFIGKSQKEFIVPLVTNGLIETSGINSRASGENFYFIVDTLELPFVDDFSKNYQLRYQGYYQGHPQVIDSAQSVYRIGGEVKDEIKYKKTPNYSYYYSSVSGNVDTVLNDSVWIQIFNKEQGEFINYDFGWMAEDYYYSNGSLVSVTSTSYDSLLKDSVWFKFYVNDTTKHWLDNDAWINYTMGVDPPTIGVATLDGIDSLGHPYDFASPGRHGEADFLTSYPLNLEGKEDVKLSFYYQPQGLGNAPEAIDSLVLEFYANGYWHWVWSSQGFNLKDFTYVDIPIEDSIFLYKGFQFRFKNYATLSGALDQWHIDYVYLDQGRVGNSSEINDLAFKEIETSFINNYQAMPYQHYLTDPSAYIKNDVEFSLVNFSSKELEGRNKYEVFDWITNTSIFTAEERLEIGLPSFATRTYNHDVKGASNQFTFPDQGGDTRTFKIRYISNSNTIQASELNTSNDTVYFEQAFDNYYAYDDGTPEQGFAVAGGGAMVAYQFRLLEPDTLTGVAINFLEMFEDVENSFKIKVWSHADTIPGNSIYESDYYSVPKLIVDKDLRTPLSFVSKEIDTLLILPAGIYYIGWKQERDHKFFVGYDMNNNASDKLFYSTGNGWEKFSEPGAVLMRPEFGKSTYKPIISASIQKLDRKFTLYPNPVRDYLSIEFTGSDICNIAIYDMFGKLTMQTSIASKEQISIASLANGMYTCRIFNGDYESIQKLIVNR